MNNERIAAQMLEIDVKPELLKDPAKSDKQSNTDAEINAHNTNIPSRDTKYDGVEDILD